MCVCVCVCVCACVCVRVRVHTCVYASFLFVLVSVCPPLPGSAILKINFVGELNDKMKGFYRSKYASPSGEVRYAAVTQFEVRDGPHTHTRTHAHAHTIE